MFPISANGQLNLRIISAVAYNFIAYLAIGLTLAILPGYVHLTLGLNTVLAGLMVSLQYIATFAMRHRAGHMCDTRGPRRTVRWGMVFCAASGALMALSWVLRGHLWLGLGALAISRLTLGASESLATTGSMMWGIGRAGHDYITRVISWNGVTTYCALAVGAPLGVLLASRLGFGAVGGLLLLLGAGGFIGSGRMAPVEPPGGDAVPITRLLWGVSPYGLALALGGLGFGVIATFITLYFAQRHWQGAALSLSVFGLCFVGARLSCSRFIDRYGGFRVAMVSFAVEAAGLALLALGPSQALAYIGSGLTGLGFSLIFPAMGVEATSVFPIAVRGSVLGVYSSFVDVSLFAAGPLAGAMIVHGGYPAVFLATAGAVLLALAGTVWLASTARAAS